MLTKTGRITLINAVLTSITTYYLTMFAPSKWLITRIDKLRRGFLWRGEDEAAGSHCAVNWKQVCSPTRFGGLGIKNLANGNWMRGPQRLTTTTDLHCFFSLWQHIQQVNLTDEPDAICWKTSSSNHYSASSAYDLQFLGSINRPALDKIMAYQV